MIGLAFTGVLVAIVAVGRLGSEDPAASPPPTPPASTLPDAAEPTNPALQPADAAEPQAELPADPAPFGGFTQDAQGAINAAEAYLEFTEAVVTMSPTDAGDAQRSISTAGAGDALAAEVEATMTSVRAQAPNGIQVWVSSLGSRATKTDVGFEVSVWYVEVIAIGTDLVLDDWRTVTYTLVWEDNNWLIDAKVSLVGPVPARSTSLTPTPAPTLVATLGAYSDGGDQ